MPKSFYRFFLISFFIFLLFFITGVNKIQAQEGSFLIVEVQIAGDDSDFDYIKIYNPFNEEKDVSGFKLRKRTSTGTESSIRVLPTGTKIKAKDFIIWANKKYSVQIGATLESTSTLSKNNSIAFFNKEEVLIDALAWGESTNPFAESQSFSKNPDKNQQLARKQTAGVYVDTNNNQNDFYLKGAEVSEEPAEENEQNHEGQISTESGFNFSDLPPGNKPPIANAGQDFVALVGQVLEFDGSNSYEPENQKISFLWNFGDGKTSEEIKPKHIYDFPGNYQVVLEVSDGNKSSVDDLKATIFPTGIIISEIFPNPESSDKGKEWIEIYNNNNQIVDISGFGIFSKSSKFIFPQNSFIFGKQFLAIKPSFSLTNKEGEVEFVYPNNWRIQKINYSEAKEGQSLVFFNNDFYFSNIPTPGQKNIMGFEDGKIKQLGDENKVRSFNVKEINSQALLKEFDLSSVNSGLVIVQNQDLAANNVQGNSSSNFPENNIESWIKAQIGNIKTKDLLILVFPTILGLLVFVFFFFKRINY
jgi:hypothetical protein